MQGQGRRCVTCFCEDLGREIVDSYPPFAVKDCLHFVFHDLQHAEKLVDPELYCEQVGFLHEMRKVWARSRAGNFRVPMSLELRRDIAHVVSDMNCCSVQMLDFLLARWQGAAGIVSLAHASLRATMWWKHIVPEAQMSWRCRSGFPSISARSKRNSLLVIWSGHGADHSSGRGHVLLRQ